MIITATYDSHDVKTINVPDGSNLELRTEVSHDKGVYTWLLVHDAQYRLIAALYDVQEFTTDEVTVKAEGKDTWIK